MENPLYRSGLIGDDCLELGNITASAPPAPDDMIYPRLPTPGFVQSTNFTMATANYNIMAGAFGIATFVNPSKCRRVSHMILSIFTACFMVVCVVASGVWAVMIVVSRNRCYDDQRYGSRDYYNCPDIGFPFGLAVSSACIAFLTFITSIVSAAMVCCNNSRCCCRCCCCCLGANEEMAIGVVGNDGNTVYVAMALGGAAASGSQFHGTNESGKQKVVVVQQGVA